MTSLRWEEYSLGWRGYSGNLLVGEIITAKDDHGWQLVAVEPGVPGIRTMGRAVRLEGAKEAVEKNWNRWVKNAQLRPDVPGDGAFKDEDGTLVLHMTGLDPSDAMREFFNYLSPAGDTFSGVMISPHNRATDPLSWTFGVSYHIKGRRYLHTSWQMVGLEQDPLSYEDEQ